MTDSILDALEPADARRVLAAGRALTLPQGWSPIAESTPADKAYVVLSGEVSVRVKGREIARVGAGDIVGEAAIVNGSLRTATVVALTPLELLHLSADAVRELSAELPAFREALQLPRSARYLSREERGLIAFLDSLSADEAPKLEAVAQAA